MNQEQLSEQYIDALREAGNIGAGNAMTALSTLLQKSVNMNVAQVNIRQITELGKVLGDEGNYIVAMLIEVYGDLNAMLMLALETESAQQVIKHMVNETVTIDEFSEFHKSALSEAGNILAGAYLGALGTLINFELAPSIPQMAIDMAGAILSYPAIQYATEDNSMVFIETHFTDQEELLNGTYIFVLDEQSFEKTVERLKEMI